MHLPVEKHIIIAKNCQLIKIQLFITALIKVTPCIYLQQYKPNLMIELGVPSKISSFWHYFRDKGLNILFKFVCRLRNVSKNKMFGYIAITASGILHAHYF
jgi:hypothetical protein